MTTKRYQACLFAALLGLFAGGDLQAQTDCVVSGRVFRSDGTPAANETVTVVKVEQNGTVVTSTSTDYQSDLNGFVTFSVPRNSSAWIQGNNVNGFNVLGGVPLSIPDAPTASLENLWQLLDGVTSFNGRAGDVTLSTNDIVSALGYNPVSPASIISTINSSTEAATIADNFLSANVPRLSTPNSFQASLSAPAIYGGSSNSSTLNIAGTSSTSSTHGDVILNGDAQGNVLIGTRTNGSGQLLDSTGRLSVTGGSVPGLTALRLNSTGTGSALDIYTPLGSDGKVVRIITPNYPSFFQPRTYINNSGAYYTNAWMVISGHTTGTDAAGYAITHPSNDPFMLGIWADVAGPSLQVRGGGYLFSGLSNSGVYSFSIEEFGQLRWGASTRAAMDTNLYRNGANTLKTDGTFQVGGDFLIGNRRNRSVTRSLPAGVNGTIDIGSFGFVNGAQMLSVTVAMPANGFSVTKTYRLPVQWNQSPANTWLAAAPAASSGPYLGADFDMDVKVSGGTVSLRLRNTGANGASGTAYVSLQEEGSTTSTTFTPSTLAGSATAPGQLYAGNLVAQNGSGVGIATIAPASDAVLDVNGGDSKGFRVRPRSTIGAPTSGSWSIGTIIVDASGTPFICTTSGTPGTWKRAVTDSGNGSVSVTSFNNRSGAVVLTGADVVAALGYTPAQLNGPQTGTLSIQTASPTTVASVVQGAASQSANLQEWRDSNGNALLAVTSTGQIRIPTTLPGTAPFAIDYKNVPDGHGTFDPIVMFGYNQTGNGGKIQTNENSLSWAVEGDYNDGTPNHKMESYLQYSSADGSQVVRPIFFQVDKVTNRLTSAMIEGNPLNVTDDNLNLLAQFAPYGARILPALSVGSNTSAAADAALDINGGDTKGLRIRPRSSPGAPGPGSGNWSVGTMIVDSTGTLYICTASGGPGVWQKIGSQ